MYPSVCLSVKLSTEWCGEALMIDIIREETKEINFMKKASTVNEARFNLFSIKATTKGPTDRLFFYKDGWFGLWLDYPCFYESMDASTIKQTDGRTNKRINGPTVSWYCIYLSTMRGSISCVTQSFWAEGVDVLRRITKNYIRARVSLTPDRLFRYVLASL